MVKIKKFNGHLEQVKAARKHGYPGPIKLIISEYEKGRTAQEIGDMLELTAGSIFYRLRQLGIIKKQGMGNRPMINSANRRIAEATARLGYGNPSEMFEQEYHRTLSTNKMAEIINVSPGCIINNLDRLGVKRVRRNRKW